MPSPLTRIRHLLRPGRLVRTLGYHLGLYRLARRPRAGLHLGCGAARIEGFLNLDAGALAKSDVIAGIERLKLRTASVRTIYASHVFEHLPRRAVRDVLEAWHRVLVPGGTLYLLVPDLAALSRIYLETLEDYDAPGAAERAALAAGIVFGGQADRRDVHYFGYAFETLRDLLLACGFRDVERFERRALDFAPASDAGDAEIEGRPVSLNVAAKA